MHTTCGIFSTMNNISKRELKPRFYVVFVRLMQQRQFWLFAAWTLEVLYCLPLRSWALWLRLVLGILLSAEITGKINALAFFLSFSVRQLWLELQWFCSLWECCCYCGVPLCQSSGVDNAIFRWMQCQSDIRMNARTPGFTLLPVIGFMDIRCGRFLLWNGMEVPFRLNNTLQYLQTEQITFTLIVVCAIWSS